MLETLYLRATSEDLEHLVPNLTSQLRGRLEVANMQSIVLDMDPQEEFEIPPDSPEQDWQSSNCQIRIELTSSMGEKLTDEALDLIDEQLMEILHDVMKEYSAVRYFSILEAD